MAEPETPYRKGEEEEEEDEEDIDETVSTKKREDVNHLSFS